MISILTNFLPELIIILSFSGIVYLFIRKSPNVAQKEARFINLLKKFWRNFCIQFRRFSRLLVSNSRVALDRLQDLAKKYKKYNKQKQISKLKKLRAINNRTKEQHYIQMIAKNPKSVVAYEKLARFYWHNEDSKHARICWQQILRIEPKNKQAQQRLNEIKESQIKG